MSALSRPLPQMSPESLPFWDGCREGKLLLQYCDHCGKINWFPRAFCFSCTGAAFTWRPARGNGILETYSTVHRAMSEAWEAEIPYTLAIVMLTEGIRMVTRLLPHPGREPKVDAPVRVRFVSVGGGLQLPFFEEVD